MATHSHGKRDEEKGTVRVAIPRQSEKDADAEKKEKLGKQAKEDAGDAAYSSAHAEKTGKARDHEVAANHNDMAARSHAAAGDDAKAKEYSERSDAHQAKADAKRNGPALKAFAKSRIG